MNYRLRAWLPAMATMLFMSSAAVAATENLSVDGGVRQVAERKLDGYREVLQQFDAAIAAAPDDAALAVQRCDFISAFTDEEYDWVEAAPDDFDACSAELLQRHGDAPEVHLFQLDQGWGKEALAEGEALLPVATKWPEPMRARLFAKLSEFAQYGSSGNRAGTYAVQAAELGDSSRIAEAVRHLAREAEQQRAAQLLAAAPAADSEWVASQRINAALELADGSVALAELRRYDRADFSIAGTLAGRVHLKAGEIEQATRLLGDSGDVSAPAVRARFDVAIARGDYPLAVRQIGFTDVELLKDNLQRVAVVLRLSPTSITAPQAMIGVLLFAMMMVVIAMLPGVVLIPAHYRGLQRRVRGAVAEPLFEHVGLRHAWLGLAVAMVLPMIIGAFIAPLPLFDVMFGNAGADGAAMFGVLFWGSLAALACNLWFARRMGIDQLAGDRRTLRALGWVLLGWLAVLAIGTALAMLGGGSDSATDQTRMIRAMVEGGSQSVGIFATLLLFAAIVPILEELTYRGLLLGGLSRHIGFGWANILQSMLFAGMHNDLPRFPYYFALGLIAGWLVRRYRTLGPAILLHVWNNVVATGLMMFVL